MSALTSILARNNQLLSKWASDSGNNGGDPFSEFFKKRLDGNQTVKAALDRLGERFPNLSIGTGEPGEGVKGADAKAKETTDAADRVALGDSILAGMTGDSELAKAVEDVIAAFLERSPDSNLMNFGGASVQRSLSITITTVRYSELHYSQAGGDLIGGSDLRTNFHERLADMVREFFNLKKPGEDGVEETDDAEGATEAARPSTLPGFGLGGAAMWSMEMYFSASYVSSLSGTGAGRDESAEGLLEAWNFSASFSASFTQSLGAFLPGALSGVAGGGAAFGGSMSAGQIDSVNGFLDSFLSGFGLDNGGFRTGEDGFFVNFRQRRNLLNELMELYRDKVRQDEPAVETEEEPAAEESAPVE